MDCQNQGNETSQIVVQDRTAQWPKGKALICSVRIA